MKDAPAQAIDNGRILVVDDNTAIHADFRKILGGDTAAESFATLEASFFREEITKPGARRFTLDSAGQGQEALAMVEQATLAGRPYALVFMDVRMPPGWDGIETIERIWKVDPDLQVVLCTAYSDYSWSEMVEKIGQSDRLVILKKPFDNIEVLQLAWALTEKWKLTREARENLARTERIVEERTSELRAANEQLQTEMAQRRQAEAQLLRAQRLESIGTLASGIAHDLNNMLSPILMSAELLRMQMPADCQDLVSLIESSAGRAASVVKQVLTFARGIEGERLPLQLRQLVGEVGNIIHEVFPRQIHLDTRLPDDLALIEGDATQLHQVLLNLCVNARDAMPDGGTLKIEADDFAVDEQMAAMTPGARVGNYVRVRVADTGSGIPQNLLAKIFDPFFTTKPLGKGTGLGLSTAVGIVKSHGGFLDVRSEVGQGTTFEVFLPAAHECAPSAAPAEAAVGRAGRGQLILVVDDESALREVTRSVLTENGYHTLGAADGAEALSIFASQTGGIDAVFTDMMMPVVDGVALCRALKKMDPDVRIIASTGCVDESRLQELRSLQIWRVLGKPFTTCALLSALGEILPLNDSGLSAQPAN